MGEHSTSTSVTRTMSISRSVMSDWSSQGSGSKHERVLFELKELVDVDAGKMLLQSVGMKRLCTLDPDTHNTSAEDAKWSAAHCAAIKATVLLASVVGGYLPVRYYMHDAQEGLGRMKANAMVQGMNPIPYVRMIRQARAVLAAKYYWDVDMVNCQPSLFEQVLVEHHIPCPCLSRYNQNRESCIRNVMHACGVTRDESKKLFIRLLFFGGITGWLQEHPHANQSALPEWVFALKDELRASANMLLKMQTRILPQVKESFTKRKIAFSEHLAHRSRHHRGCSCQTSRS